jgi:hypothetical protein
VEVIEDMADFKIVKQTASNKESAIILCFYGSKEWNYWYPKEHQFPGILRAVAKYYESDFAEKLIKRNIQEVNKEW